MQLVPVIPALDKAQIAESACPALETAGAKKRHRV